MRQPDSELVYPLPILKGVSGTLESLLLRLKKPVPTLYETISPQLESEIDEQLHCHGELDPNIGYVDFENNAVFTFVHNSLSSSSKMQDFHRWQYHFNMTVGRSH